jgi:virulence-associated protein VagC
MRTCTFQIGDEEAVLLPDEVAYHVDDLELVVRRVGDVITLRPLRPDKVAAETGPAGPSET